MSKNWYPIIDFSLCNECLICVEFCPHGVYDREKAIPSVVNPDKCIEGCKGCLNQCPAEAISYFGDDGTKQYLGECGCSCSCDCN